MNRQIKYSCPKCGSVTYDSMQIRTSGNLFTSVMNINNRKFDALVCTNCRYTEFYFIPSGSKKEM